MHNSENGMMDDMGMEEDIMPYPNLVDNAAAKRTKKK